MSAPTLFVVEHNVQDKEAWGKFFGEQLAGLKDKTVEEAAADDSYGGNKCLLTSSSVDGNKTFCIWEFPAGSTAEDCQAHVDKFTGGEPVVKNVVYTVDGSLGISNFSFDTYIKDMIKLATGGSVHGCADDGELFLVHHKIPDKAKWDAMFGEKVGLLKGKTTTKDITEAWEVGEGAKGAMWCGLGDGDAVCLWSMPKGSTEAEFQTMIDTFLGDAATNEVFKIEPSTCIGSRLVHPDFYTQEVIAYANAMAA